jgi:hypothetical protein
MQGDQYAEQCQTVTCATSRTAETHLLRPGGIAVCRDKADVQVRHAMFDGFTPQQIKTQATTINLVRGGSGYPILLLHGYPQTHVCWHCAAAARQSTLLVSERSWRAGLGRALLAR